MDLSSKGTFGKNSTEHTYLASDDNRKTGRVPPGNLFTSTEKKQPDSIHLQTVQRAQINCWKNRKKLELRLRWPLSEEMLLNH